MTRASAALQHHRTSPVGSRCRVEKNGAPIDLPSTTFFVDGNTTTTTTAAVTSLSTFQVIANCIDPGDFFNNHHHPTMDGNMIAIRVDQIN